MRSEQEMYDTIINYAKTDQRVRAVYMNGSRTNPNVDKDNFRDYDIVFVVWETESFLAEKEWISVFGDIAIVQEPDSNDLGWGIGHDFSRSYTWLMLFKDGNRIDLEIRVLERALENYLEDTLCIKLLDKEGILPQLPDSNDSLYWIKPPSKETFAGCCNEFFWCLNNVAKGIARDQMPYALRMYYDVVHVELDKMLEWYIGIKNDFSVTSGMWGKYFKKYLPPEIYQQYIKTYSDGSHNLWDAIFMACGLFRSIALEVSEHCGYIYNISDDKNIIIYLKNVKEFHR